MAKRRKSEEEAPPADLLRIDFDYWPGLEGASAGREVVFQALHKDDVAQFKSLGYQPVVLRQLPVSNGPDVVIYNRYLLRGVLDGTIEVTARQAAALELDMRHRNMLDKRSVEDPMTASRAEGMKEILDWNASRHSMDNTTTVGVEDVRRFVMTLKGKADERLRPPEPPSRERPVQQLPGPREARRKRRSNARRGVSQPKGGRGGTR